MILVIHTLHRERVELALVRPVGRGIGQQWQLVRELRRPATSQRTEVLTPAVDQLLKAAKIKLPALTGIVVATGPGGFSAVRSGVVVANALGLALGIPVVGVEGEFLGVQDMLSSDRFPRTLKSKPTFARPSYGAEPHITKAKHKKIQQHTLKP